MAENEITTAKIASIEEATAEAEAEEAMVSADAEEDTAAESTAPLTADDELAEIEANGSAVAFLEKLEGEGSGEDTEDEPEEDTAPAAPVKKPAARRRAAVKKPVDETGTAQTKEPLYLNKDDEHLTAKNIEKAKWTEIVTAARTEKILSGEISGIEKTQNGYIAVVYHNDMRVIIPFSELGITLETGKPDEDNSHRMLLIVNSMVGAEIDFIIPRKGYEEKTHSIVASRKMAMEKKQRLFYLTPGRNQIVPGKLVEARVVAAHPRIIRFEVFGVEYRAEAPELSLNWVADATTLYHVGDRVPVKITNVKLTGNKVEIEIDFKESHRQEILEKLHSLKRGSQYSGFVRSIINGHYNIELANNICVTSTECKDVTKPRVGDKVVFVPTNEEEKKCRVYGIIARIIKPALQ